MPKALLLVCLFSLISISRPGWTEGKLAYRGLVELQAFYNDAADRWMNGGLSKSRYDEDSFPLRLGKAGLQVDYHFTDTLWLQTLTDFYVDDGVEAELIEAYFQYRPVPDGPMRLRARVGAFNPPVSLENTDLAWSSSMSTTPSVINTWAGEDLRTVGAEITLDWPGRLRQSTHGWKLTGAIFGYNDANGTILYTRGWAAHDRQTGLFSPLREPTLVPDVRKEVFTFHEFDDRPGYYLSGVWTWRDQFNLQIFHYDNMAETGLVSGNTSSWRTAFNQVAAEWRLPRQWLLATQAMIGDTKAANPLSGDEFGSDFRAIYFLVNKIMNKHSFTARVEYFSVDDLDHYNTGYSQESGHSLLIAWQYPYSQHIRLGAEWLFIDSNRSERRLLTGNGKEQINQLLFTVQYRFQN